MDPDKTKDPLDPQQHGGQRPTHEDSKRPKPMS